MLQSKNKSFITILLLFCVSFVFAQPPKKPTYPYKITNLKGFLYYNSNKSSTDYDVAGKFSEDVFTMKDVAFFNTPIGEGSAKGKSTQMMIVVELEGSPKEFTERTIRLLITDELGKTTEKFHKFAILDNSKKYMAAFWLDEIGCSTLKIRAEVQKRADGKDGKLQGVEDQREKKVEFVCGE